MVDLDRLRELRELTDSLEHQARPLPLDEVRDRGRRRRRRRHVAVGSGVLLVTLFVGGAVLEGPVRSFRDEPPIARSAEVTATPVPVRTLTGANLIAAADVPTAAPGGEVEQYEEGARNPDKVSVCIPDGLSSLGATTVVSRSFREVPSGTADPSDPMRGQPSVYAVALQFPDADAAARAAGIYQAWVDDCLAGRGPVAGEFEAVTSTGWTEVPAPGGRGEVALLAYREPGSSSEAAYWETTGLTTVQDRLMITVDLSYGQDHNTTLDPADQDQTPDPQLALVAAAAERLGR